MDGRPVQAVGPAHQEVRDVDGQRARAHGARPPEGLVVGRRRRREQDFEARVRRREEQREALVVRVRPEPQLAGRVGFLGRGFLAQWRLPRVVEQARDAARVRRRGVEVVLLEIQRQREQPEQVACHLQHLPVVHGDFGVEARQGLLGRPDVADPRRGGRHAVELDVLAVAARWVQARLVAPVEALLGLLLRAALVVGVDVRRVVRLVPAHERRVLDVQRLLLLVGQFVEEPARLLQHARHRLGRHAVVADLEEPRRHARIADLVCHRFPRLEVAVEGRADVYQGHRW